MALRGYLDLTSSRHFLSGSLDHPLPAGLRLCIVCHAPTSSGNRLLHNHVRQSFVPEHKRRIGAQILHSVRLFVFAIFRPHERTNNPYGDGTEVLRIGRGHRLRMPAGNTVPAAFEVIPDK